MTVPTVDVADLLTPEGAALAFRRAEVDVDAVEPMYVRQKPGETSIISYRMSGPWGTTWGYTHWCADRERAEMIHQKALRMRPRPSAPGPGIVRVDAHTSLRFLPNDGRLRRLRWYTEPRKLKRSLGSLNPSESRGLSGGKSGVEIVRYKPERRIVAAVVLGAVDGTTRHLFLRYSTARTATQLALTARGLRSNGVKIPEPVAQLEEGHVSIDEFVSGIQLRDAIRAGLDSPSEFARSLHRFHGTNAPTHLHTRQVSAELEHAIGNLTALGMWDRELAGPARHVASLLRNHQPVNPATPVLVHGDLHSKNVLVSNGEHIFVDLERCAVGAKEIDLGTMLAHAMATEVRRPGFSPDAERHACSMLDRYAAMSPVDRASLDFHTVVGLVDQALLVTRHVEPGWFESANELLTLAIDVLRRGAGTPRS